MTRARVGVVGEVFLDLHPGLEGAPGSRLGGVLHACRALSALDVRFTCAPILPDYLADAVRAECSSLGGECEVLGLISGTPNVAVYRDACESGDQGVEMPVLIGSHACTMVDEVLDRLPSSMTDALIIPGYYPLGTVLRHLEESGIKLHVDISYDTSLPDLLNGPPLETIFLSTSSELFLTHWAADPQQAWSALSAVAKTVILKESRGGSRAFCEGVSISAPAFVGAALHSVGLGDCYDAAYLRLNETAIEKRLVLCSAVAAAYSDTWDQEQFAATTKSVLSGGSLEEHLSISLPWEARPRYSIYIAAPDFPEVNLTPLENLLQALEYHNFHCRLPIRENGLADTTLSTAELERYCCADLKLLDECELLLAVMLFDDPGTLIEVGIAAARGVPVVVYDPYDRARNVMLRCVPTLLSSDLSAVITEVFRAIGEAHARD